MRQISLTQGLQNKYAPIEDITDQIPKHASKRWSMRNKDEINSIVIHHAASESPLVNQAKYHVNSHGWPGIGYHLMISQGRIFQVNDLLAESAHCKGHNDHSIGICILGDLSKRSITPLESELVSAAIVTVKSLLDIKEVVGHNKWVKTACPCTSMDRIREEVETLETKLELEAELNDNLQLQLLNAAALHERVKDLYGKASNPGKYQLEAIKKLSRIGDMMRSAGLL